MGERWGEGGGRGVAAAAGDATLRRCWRSANRHGNFIPLWLLGRSRRFYAIRCRRSRFRQASRLFIISQLACLPGPDLFSSLQQIQRRGDPPRGRRDILTPVKSICLRCLQHRAHHNAASSRERREIRVSRVLSSETRFSRANLKGIRLSGVT